MKTVIGILALVFFGLFIFRVIFGPAQKQKQNSSDTGEGESDADEKS